MPLSEYFRILRRWGWVLVLMALLTAASARRQANLVARGTRPSNPHRVAMCGTESFTRRQHG